MLSFELFSLFITTHLIYAFHPTDQIENSSSTQRNDEIPSPSSSSSSPLSSSSQSSSSSSQKELRLLRRLQLWTESQTRCKYPTGMPNNLLGSDHFLIMAEFGVKIEA